MAAAAGHADKLSWQLPAVTLEPQTPKKLWAPSVQLGAGIAQCHNYRGTDVTSVPSAALHAG